MPVDRETLDNAITRLMERFSAEELQAMMLAQENLWDHLPWQDRFAFGLFKGEIAEVFLDLSALHVLGSLQRVRPEVAQVVTSGDGLRWLGDQVESLRGRALRASPG